MSAAAHGAAPVAPGAESVVAAATPADVAAGTPAAPDRLPLIALVCLVATVAIATITPWPVGAFQDDAIYTVLAKSLAEGQGYRLLNLPGEPNATHFPPGYPLVLAAIWRAWPSFPDNLVAFKFANAIFLALAAAGTYRLMRVRFASPPRAAFAYAVVGTLSIVVLYVTGVVMSEPLFMAMMFPSLLAAERAVDTGRPRDAVVAGLWLGAWSLVRTLGAFAIPAAIVALALRRHWRSAAALALASAVFLVPWQLWVNANDASVPGVLVGKFGSYGSWLADGYRDGGWPFAREVFKRNLADLDGMLSYLLMPVQAAWPRGIAIVAAVGLALLGTGRFARNAPVTLLFVTAYTMVVMLWPFEPNRFVLAVWPLWLPLMAGGALLLWRMRAPRPALLVVRSATAIAACGLAGGFAWYNGMGYSRQWWASVQRDAGERAKPIVEWASRHTEQDAVLSTEDDVMVYLYAGRQAVPTSTFTASERVKPLTDAEHLEAVREIFATYRPSFYVVASRQGNRIAAALAAQHPPAARPVGRTPQAMIYQRLEP